jgi:D-alanyl-D-alanine carboxypeptidase/D-alanyl-D-alanine-endopeptidase (penicillin-binding protein 4)
MMLGSSHRLHGIPWALALLALLAPLPGGAGDPAGDGAELSQALSRIVASSALERSRTGILVASLETGEVLFARNADELLNPASNVKLFTSAAALARLGPDYRFDTEIYVDAGEGGGPRTLYVRGKGDPSMVTERLWAVAGDIFHLGLRSLKEIVVDDSWFDGEREGPGFDQERGDRAYLAPVGALSLNFNAVAIHVAPGSRVGEKGRVSLEPPSDFLVLDDRTLTAGVRARRRVVPSSVLEGGRQRILVQARLPLGSRAQVFHRKVDDPPLYFGYTLKRLLELRGVKVAGKVRRGTVPEGARLLAVSQSEPLAEVVRRLEKTSNNFIAEQILKTLGAEAKGTPGSWPKGVEAVEDFLAEAGIPRGSYIMKNGSGLNDANRFSARQTVALLREMWRRFPLMAEFVAALPVAGRDGTIRWRMEDSDAAGRLRAKTGTLENVASLSGYVESRGGAKLAFAVLVNDYPGRGASVVRALDALGGALAAVGGPPEEMGAAVAAAVAPAPVPAASDADLAARVATYYRLGKAGDPRNLRLLRTAIRGERQLVLRLAAAEAAYLSDPDHDAARKTFLENAGTDAATLATLQVLAAPLDIPSPVLGSLADLAAEGLSDALIRLVENTLACGGRPAFAADLADIWAEVARSAPDEVLSALRTSPPPAVDAVLSSLARGLARPEEADHPFPAAVARALSGDDPDLASFARALSPRLAERMRPAPAPASADPAGTPASRPETRPGGG